MSQAVANRWAVILGAVVLVGFLAAMAGATLSPPPEWLLGWTSWLASAVSIVLAPIAVIAAAHALHRWALKN